MSWMGTDGGWASTRVGGDCTRDYTRCFGGALTGFGERFVKVKKVGPVGFEPTTKGL
jgi:hypothetical protein